MAFRHIFRHLLYTHAIACYVAAIVGAGLTSGGHVTVFVSYAFIVFISPIVLPIAVMLESWQQAYICAAVYCVAFCVGIYGLLRRRKAWQDQAKQLILASHSDPAATRPLMYFAAVHEDLIDYNPLEVSALVSALSAIVAIGATIGVGIAANRRNTAVPAIGTGCLALLLIAPCAAVVAGLVAAFRTPPHTPIRKIGVVGLCVGIVMTMLLVYLIYMRASGLIQFDG